MIFTFAVRIIVDMKMIFLYGPPAVGKLTVAKELAKITGYKLFHNHLTVDLVSSLYEWGSPKYWEYLRNIREQLLANLTKDDVGIIFTYVYAAGEDEEVMERMFKKVEENGGEVLLVQLTTSVEKLKERIVAEDRRQFKKMHKTESLESWISQYKLFEAYPNRQNLVVDNSNMTPTEVANLIVEKYKLNQITN